MKRWLRLPKLNSRLYYVLLAIFAIVVLGPLGAIVGAFMLFSLGFSVGGQVIAGILGSAVTFGYGSEGKHGANYMQTAAASVASVGSLAVLIQARAWLGLPEINTWVFMTYVCCIGMFGIGVGMLYTGLVVDKMKLTFPSGLAVANILRALTDKDLLKQSIAKLGSGTGVGFLLGLASNKLGSLQSTGLSVATIGVGMIVGARIAVPGLLMAVIGEEMLLWLQYTNYIEPGDPFRKIGFIVALGMIIGAAVVDMISIGAEAVRQWKTQSKETSKEIVPDWQKTNKVRLVFWIIFWGGATFFVGTQLLGLPVLPLTLAMGLVFVFLLINGISMGISDSNPVSAAFVIGVFLMATIGLKDIGAGLLCAAVLLVACAVGVDMQQDRSTGWRLGTNRTIQFRYQMIGIIVGSILCVLLAKMFITAYPILGVNQYGVPPISGADKWSSAFTYKLVGALKGLTNPNPDFIFALELGGLIGMATELLRKLLKQWKRYQNFVAGSKLGFGVDFTMDTFALPSPYASSFGGFVPVMVTVWFAIGGIMASFAKMVQNEGKGTTNTEGNEATEEISTISLIGGGLIAGDTLAAFALGIYTLLAML